MKRPRPKPARWRWQIDRGNGWETIPAQDAVDLVRHSLSINRHLGRLSLAGIKRLAAARIAHARVDGAPIPVCADGRRRSDVWLVRVTRGAR